MLETITCRIHYSFSSDAVGLYTFALVLLRQFPVRYFPVRHFPVLQIPRFLMVRHFPLLQIPVTRHLLVNLSTAV